MIEIQNVTLGADPELFLTKNNEVISAEGMIGGTKEKPKLISKEGHAVQEDNVMIEFNIPASSTEDEFVNNINIVLEYLSAHAKLIGCETKIIPSAELDPIFLDTRQAKEFGCDPDFNVYLKDINTAPCSKTALRTCGGHIHVGYNKPTQEIGEKIIYAMDITLGLPSILLDNDNRRREMYGKAGAFRFKEYGIEYRTLSNFWIKSDNLKRWAFNKTIEALELVNSGIIDIIIDELADEVRTAIDKQDVSLVGEVSTKIEKIKQENLIKK